MLSSLALFYLYLTLARTRVDLGREVAGSGVETGLAFRRQMRTEPTHALGLSLVLLLLFSFLQFGTLLTSECWDYTVPSQTWLEAYYKSGMKTDHVTRFISFHLSRQSKIQRGSEIRAGLPSWQVIAV